MTRRAEKIEGKRGSAAAAEQCSSNQRRGLAGENPCPNYDAILTFFFALTYAAAHAGPKSGITGAPA